MYLAMRLVLNWIKPNEVVSLQMKSEMIDWLVPKQQIEQTLII